MAFEFNDDDKLDLIALKYIFDVIVFSPVEALLELVDIGGLSGIAGDSATLSLLNTVPEFLARCHGEDGNNPTVAEWGLEKKKYLYAFGVDKLGLINREDMRLQFADYARFLYGNLRNDIAHSIVSGKVNFYKEMQGEYGHFSYYMKDYDEAFTSENIARIASFSCHVPTLYRKVREGVERFVMQVETGEEELRIENANKEFFHIPGFLGFVEREKSLVFLLEKIKEYWPDREFGW